MEKELYTITAFSENHIGLLNRITIIFTRRHLNIESLTVSSTEMKGIHRFTIVVEASLDLIERVTNQIEKLPEVLRAAWYVNDDIVYREIALYKIPINYAIDRNIEQVLREYNARLVDIQNDFVIIEKTGHVEDTEKLYDVLKPYKILQFVRSGRISISKHKKELATYLSELPINEYIKE
ncbi:MAG: acetolactate synthase small subunit [Marinilabiliaceae bacterium]|nr:acetolactate synthase small subunit [Marinilabiliaceae bacterium]